MSDPIVSTEWDVVVIGAGPAGCIAARELAHRGKKTLLVDKAHFPRAKVCGGCLNGNALSALKAVGLGELPSAIGGSPIHQMVLAANGRTATIPLPDGIAISRTALDHALIQEAIHAGVTFRAGMKATMGELTNEIRIVELNDGSNLSTITARIVITADGLNGRASNLDGVEAKASSHSRLGAGVVLSIDTDHYPAHRIHMATAAGGYVGLVRVERNLLDIAAAFDPEFVRTSGSLGLAAESVLREAGFPTVPGLSTATWKGTPALTRKPTQIAGKRWFAVGDAAGYVEPFTGEGMAWAMSGARAVAEIAVRGMDTFSDALIHEWTRIHRKLIGKRQWSCRVVSRLLRSPRACRMLVWVLSHVPRLAVPFVRNLNRPTRMVGGIT